MLPCGARAGTLFHVAVALACLEALAAFSTLPAAAPRPRARAMTLRASAPPPSASGEAGLGRRAALQALVFASGAVLGGGEVFAAVPSQSEYNVGSGTVIRPLAPAVEKAPEVPKATDLASLKSALKEAEGTLGEMKGLVDKGAWDDIRGLMQRQPAGQKFIKPQLPSVLFDVFGGLETEKAFVAACGVDAAQAKKFEKARNNAAQVLRELADFCFTNRVLFFNDEDKKNVAKLESNLEVDLDEARSFVDGAMDSLKDMVKVLP